MDSGSRFDICIAFVLPHETEFNRDGSVKVERDPRDPGGTTKYGIDQRDHPHVDVAKLDEPGAREIFRAEEWTKAQCAKFKPNWDLAIFDSAVNPGLGFVGKALQRAVGGLWVDGFIGPKTIAATNAASIDHLSKFLDLRLAYYEARPETLNGRPFKSAYIGGWRARVADLRKACHV